MHPPLIGATASRTFNPLGDPRATLMETYVQALVQAGAIPVIIPLGLPEEMLRSLFARLDGILFTGGGDVAPERYGGGSHPEVSEINRDRDDLEIELIQQAAAGQKPFLGICRGIQVINVALGGTLYEDVLDQRPGSLQHQYTKTHPRDYLAHTVLVSAASRLAQALDAPGTEVKVNSFHHQGIDRLAPALEATAYAPDGLIEGVELPGHKFGVAVQWHPECLTAYPEMRSLFRSFVIASSNGAGANPA